MQHKAPNKKLSTTSLVLIAVIWGLSFIYISMEFRDAGLIKPFICQS